MVYVCDIVPPPRLIPRPRLDVPASAQRVDDLGFLREALQLELREYELAVRGDFESAAG